MEILNSHSTHVVKTMPSAISFGDITLYPTYRKVIKAGREVHLNHSEVNAP